MGIDMKRKALLIGNTSGLGGVTADMNAWRKFLCSDQGGCWNDDEIIMRTNISYANLHMLIQAIKEEHNDFVIVVFSGHGGVREDQILYLNSSDETILESELKGLAQRQITELDCCRVREAAVESRTRLFSNGGVIRDNVDQRARIRALYDRRIMQACPQQVTLYACSLGESAYDNGSYGYFTHNLLAVAQEVGDYDYKTIYDIMPEAQRRTIYNVFQHEMANQHPTVAKPRCLPSQDLILSINPNVGEL